MVPINAVGASGAKYAYHLAQISGPWLAVPVNYMFVRQEPDGRWFVAYIGESDNASTRLSTHERWAEAVRVHRCTHVLNHTASADAATRRNEERDLIQSHNPPMNTHHRTEGALTA